MAGTFTKEFKINAARQLKESLDETDNDNYYFFIGRVTPWNNESTPPDTVDTVDSLYSNWKEVLALKKITASEASYVIPRKNWTINTVYDQYSDVDDELYDKDFYVVTEDFNVYKCISNGGSANSTIKPTGTSTSIFSTADGYKWKFMYQIPATDAIRFLTTTFMPVRLLTSDDGSFQWDVQDAAINGALHHYDVTSGGSNYISLSGTTVSAPNTTHLQLESNANTFNNSYVNSAIYITSGTGAGQVRKIVSYVGSTTRIVEVSPPFTVQPNGTSVYYISPAVNINGDGSNAAAYSVVTGGVVTDIVPVNVGQDYSYADVTLSSNSGTGAQAVTYIPPVGGHGKEALSELGGSTLMFNVVLAADEGGKFTVNNEYRTIGIISNPRLSSNGSFAEADTYDQTHRLTVTGHTAQFVPDEVVTGLTSGATGQVVDFSSNTTLRVIRTSLTEFDDAEIITGTTSTANATISAQTIPDIVPYSGKLLYIENRSPIARSEDQRELIKISVRF